MLLSLVALRDDAIMRSFLGAPSISDDTSSREYAHCSIHSALMFWIALFSIQFSDASNKIYPKRWQWGSLCCIFFMKGCIPSVVIVEGKTGFFNATEVNPQEWSTDCSVYIFTMVFYSNPNHRSLTVAMSGSSWWFNVILRRETLLERARQ